MKKNDFSTLLFNLTIILTTLLLPITSSAFASPVCLLIEVAPLNLAQNKDTMVIPMVYVEGGTFMMGCNSDTSKLCDSDEKPAHEVTLRSFYLGQYEVTQKIWTMVMHNNPSYFNQCGEECPVENVNWNEVQTFIQRLNEQSGKTYRLPTEAEWEYAARGGRQTKNYNYAGGNTLADVAWFWDNGLQKTHDVGQKKPNELDLYDMSGNVWEWILNYKESYTDEGQNDPQGPNNGTHRVLRGGSWFDYQLRVRPSNRYFYNPLSKSNRIGFRLALSE